MDATLRALLLSWDWRPEVIASLLVFGGAYTLGWRRLRQAGARHLANGWRLAAYWSGLLIIAVSLLSAIDLLQSLLFSMHMVQHLLLMMVAAPLLVLANPFPFFVWAFSLPARRVMIGLLAGTSLFRRVVRRLTAPWLAWLLYALILWLWHAPAAYEAALRNDFIHDLEHLTFFGAGLLFWWHVVGAAPHLRGRFGYGVRIVYVIAAMFQHQALAVLITFSGQPLYPHYTAMPRIWGLSVMDDQALGGTIMWVPGGMMYVIAALVLLAVLLNREEKKSKRASHNGLASVF